MPPESPKKRKRKERNTRKRFKRRERLESDGEERVRELRGRKHGKEGMIQAFGAALTGGGRGVEGGAER